MTEADWLVCGDPSRMVSEARRLGRATDRKIRLWACLCCRRLGDLLVDDRSRRAVDVAERFAEGLATAEELAAAHAAAEVVPPADPVAAPESVGWANAAQAARLAADLELPEVAGSLVRLSTYAAAIALVEWLWANRMDPTSGETRDPETRDEMIGHYRAAYAARQVKLLREMICNPFRPVACYPEWRTDTVLSLARVMYESRDFSPMPILADALQDAGCEDGDILTHCRNPRAEHVRGCWVVDLVLGRA